MAHSLLDKPGNNPFCHHRALELRRQGLRETIRPVRAAPGRSFDHGEFEIVVETSDGCASDAVAVDLTARDERAHGTELVVCYGCMRHVFAGTATCPFCGAGVATARERHEAALAAARAAAAELLERLRRLEPQETASG
jgi:hypothetical protein